MLGGGFSTDNAKGMPEVVPGDLRVVASYPDPQTPNTWTVIGVNDTHDDHKFSAYVDCGEAKDGTTTLGITPAPLATKSVTPGSAVVAEAKCPSGENATGGGFLLPQESAANVIASEPIAGGWHIESFLPSTSTSAVDEKAYALCATMNVAGTSTVSSSFIVGNDIAKESGNTTPLCSAISGSKTYPYLSDGGFALNDDKDTTGDEAKIFQFDASSATSFPSPLTTWKAQAFNNDTNITPTPTPTLTPDATVFGSCVGG
jgi:hypothetical protein